MRKVTARRVTPMLVAALLAAATCAFADSTVIGEQALLPNPPSVNGTYLPGYTGGSAGNEGVGFQSFYAASTAQWSGDDVVCQTADDASCKMLPYYMYTAELGNCATAGATDCINGIDVTDSSGNVIHGKFQSYFPDRSSAAYTGSKARGVPSGWYPSIWTFPGITHQGGNQFLAIASLNSSWVPFQAKSANAALKIALYPISIVAEQNDDAYRGPSAPLNSNGLHRLQIGGVNDNVCALRLGEAHQCALQWPFPKNLRFNMDLHLYEPIAGWLNGHLGSPQVSVSQQSGYQDVSVTAAPVEVPLFATWKKFTDLTPDLQAYLNKKTDTGWIYAPQDLSTVWDHVGVPPWTKVTVMRGLNRFDDDNFNEMVMWLENSNNSAYASKSVWNAGNVGNNQARCVNSTSSLAGIVSSNATMYIANPPTFDHATQTLNYKVSAPHFDENGQANVGEYHLLISSAVARCIYGFTNAPIKASVNIVSANGDNEVATTTMTESNGWIRLDATGFQYSSPTIEVKLTQAGTTAKKASVPAPKPTKAPAKKK